MAKYKVNFTVTVEGPRGDEEDFRLMVEVDGKNHEDAGIKVVAKLQDLVNGPKVEAKNRFDREVL